MLGDAIAQTRDLVRSLHSPMLEAAGLPAALGELAAHIAHVFGVECRLDDRAGYDPPAPSRAQLRRIAREAVINAAKHASATRIDIELDRDAGGVTLVVRDDGVGIPARPPVGMGLHLMAYRARLLGASLEVAGGPGRGTHISVKTVESYRARLKQKMNLESGIELMRFAIHWATDGHKRETGSGTDG